MKAKMITKIGTIALVGMIAGTLALPLTGCGKKNVAEESPAVTEAAAVKCTALITVKAEGADAKTTKAKVEVRDADNKVVGSTFEIEVNKEHPVNDLTGGITR